jgi:hypothetical protein
MARGNTLVGYGYGRGMSRMPADGYKSTINPEAYNLWRDWYFGVNAVVGKSIGNITVTITGVQSGPKGTLSKSIGNITVTMTGTSPIKGTLSQSIGTIALTGTGVSTIKGALSKSIGNITILATGTAPVTGSDVNGELIQSIGLIKLYTYPRSATSNLNILSDLTNYVSVEESIVTRIELRDELYGSVFQKNRLNTEVVIYDEIC